MFDINVLCLISSLVFSILLVATFIYLLGFWYKNNGEDDKYSYIVVLFDASFYLYFIFNIFCG